MNVSLHMRLKQIEAERTDCFCDEMLSVTESIAAYLFVIGGNLNGYIVTKCGWV